MKKWMTSLLVLFMLINGFSTFNYVKAEDSVFLEVTTDDVRVRTGPSTNYKQLYLNGEYQYYSINDIFEVLGSEKDSSGLLWYNVKNIIDGNEYSTWIREDFVILYHYEYDEEFENYLKESGFPESYHQKLRYLHTLYPTWKFKAIKTDIQWNDMLAAENTIGRSLIDGNNTALRSKANGCYNESTGQYTALDGNNWYQANTETIAYFMDPRNFLNQFYIFQFIKLSFNENETEDMIQNVIDGTFMSGSVKVQTKNANGEIVEEEKTYAQIFFDSGEAANVSPIYLSTLAKQEQGSTGSAAITGEQFTYNGKTYSNLYNFYNIGASSGVDNWKKGLIYANGGESGKYTTFGRPWNSIEKSIKGGALWIADGYIDVGQDTLYAQKFNYVTKQYWHQYQTNVRAAYNESRTIFNTYQEVGALTSELTFCIPVYLNMPEKTALPTEEETPETPPTNPSEENPEVNPGEEENPEVNPGEENDNPEATSTTFNEDFNLTIIDDYVIGFDLNTEYKYITSKIKELKPTYQMIIKDDTDQEIDGTTLISTGQILVITDENGETSYRIVIDGDVNGDGIISAVDYVKIKNHIMETGVITDKYVLLAADVNNDDQISAVDYVKIKNYIMNGGN